MELSDKVFLFAKDVRTRDEVHNHIVEFLADTIIQRAFSGKEVKDLAEAKSIIDIYFASITKIVTHNPEKKQTENI